METQKNKVIAYLRVSTEQQNIDQQKLEIHEYAYKNKLHIDKFIEKTVSTKHLGNKHIDFVTKDLNKGDLLIVSELSRLGRSVGQIIQIINILTKNYIGFIAIKENIKIYGIQNMQTKILIVFFGLFAEIERDLISERTKQGLIAAKKKGKILGRPKGIGKSKLDLFKDEIKALLHNGSSKTFIAKKYNTSLTNLYNWLKKHLIK